MLRGIKLHRQGDAIFIPLPKELWQHSVFGEGCSCGKCGGDGAWDTLAVPKEIDKTNDTAWLVHFPELRNK